MWEKPKRLPPLTDSAGEFSCALLQEPDDLRLLGGGASAANHSRTLARQLHELVLVILQTDLREQDRRVSNGSGRNSQPTSAAAPRVIHFTCSSTPTVAWREGGSDHRNHFQRRYSGCGSIIVRRSGFHKVELTSSESPDITRAQSCFLLKALSSRWASPRVVTCGRPQLETHARANTLESVS